MRIRSIKPEFWRSPDIAGLSIEDRLLFIGLWSYVDDNGVGIDEPAFIAADLFAHDLSVSPHDTLMRIQGGLNRIFEADLITRYEAGSKRFLHVTTWEQHQKINRPSPGRYPTPDQGFPVEKPDTHMPLTESSVSPHVPEQGNRGTGEQGINTLPPSAVEREFDRAWPSWPKKVEKKAALAKFKIKARKRDPAELADDVIRFGEAYAATTERQFTPGLAVWLNGERWEDDLPAARGGGAAVHSNLALVARLEAEERRGIA